MDDIVNNLKNNQTSKMDNSQEELYKKARKALQLNSCNALDWNGPSADEVRNKCLKGSTLF